MIILTGTDGGVANVGINGFVLVLKLLLGIGVGRSPGVLFICMEATPIGSGFIFAVAEAGHY